MPDIRKQDADLKSAAARVKKRNMLKKQRMATAFAFIGVLLLVAILCAVLYIVDIYRFEDVNGDIYTVKKTGGKYALFDDSGEICDTTDYQNKLCYVTKIGTIVYVDAENGSTEKKIVVHTDGSEVQDFGTTVLMFKEMTYDEGSVKDKSMVIDSIEVKNSNGGFTFKREGDGFVIQGNESTSYSAMSFAILANTCGRTRSSRRLAEPVRLASGEIDFSEYGLAPSIRKRTETDEDGNEVEVEYQYTPTTYVITAVNGDRHEVVVGDLTVTGTGFYAKYNGGETHEGDTVKTLPPRDTIYVLGITEDILNGGLDGFELLNERIEAFVTPKLVYQMSVNDYFNVSSFMLKDNIDYKKINAELAEKFGEDDIGSEEFLKEYKRLFELYSHSVCSFSFYDFDDRNGTMNAYTPYISLLEYADGYYLNGDNIDTMLTGFYQTDFLEVIKLSPTDDELEKYGLSQAPYVISFLFKTENEEGEEVYVENFVDIGFKNSDGSYYAYSPVYDMIVKVGESSFAFLEWDETYWYYDRYFQMSISYVDSILIESPAFSTEFRIDDSASKYLGYVARSGKRLTVGDKEYVVKKDSNGKYILMCGDETVKPYYSGDFLLTPVVCTEGRRQANNYLFSETSEVDADGDGTNDGIMYYFYDIVKKDGDFYLAAQIVLTDLKGNAISQMQTVMGEVAYESPYFMTTTGYMFFADKASSVGANIDAMFGRSGRGEWGNGRMFVTSSGKNVVINNDDGAWVTVSDVSCGLYLADSKDSRLAQRAVEIPAKYGENGKLTRYSDIYYPMTSKKIAYLEDQDIIASYNESTNEWNKVTYSECTIGVWGECSYYVIEGGVTIAVDSKTGDIGEVAVLANQPYIADIYADGKLLNYTVEKDAYSASDKKASAMQNFQELYKYLLTASIEGLADLSDKEKDEFRALDDFTSGAQDACVLKITLKASDFKGNERNVVYRFYRYSERRAYLTIETIDGEESSSEKAYGNFSVLYTFVRKVIDDAEKVVNGQPVYLSEKY